MAKGAFYAAALIPAKMFVFFLLRLAVDAQTRHRPGFETGNADFIAAFLADAVGAVVDALPGGLNLADQTTFAVADAQGKGAVGFGRGPSAGSAKTSLLSVNSSMVLSPFCWASSSMSDRSLQEKFKVLVIHISSGRVVSHARYRFGI